MNDTLKTAFDELLKLINTQAYGELVQQIQYFVQKVPPETMRTTLAKMSKKQVIEFHGVLVLAWKSANEISRAEAEQLLKIFAVIVQSLLAAAFNQQ